MLTRYNFRRWEEESLAVLQDSESELDRANLIRNRWNALTDESREFTALSINELEPEVACFQEVDNMHSLEWFRDRFLHRRVKDPKSYRHAVIIEGNDPRGIDVAVLSRYRIVSAVTNRELTYAEINMPDPLPPGSDLDEHVFRRDCLEVNVKKNNKILPIFICHFKSMMGGRQATSWRRKAEAQALREIIEQHFNDPSNSEWVIVGDLNDYTEIDGTADRNHGLGPLVDGGFSVDLIKTRIADAKDRWTHFYASEDDYAQLDYILVSPKLAQLNQNAQVKMCRKGAPYRADRYKNDRWPRVGYNRPKASDHCPVMVELKFEG